MFQQSKGHWQGLLDDFLVTTKDLCDKLLQKGLESSFGKWEKTELYSTLQNIANDFFRQVFLEQESFAGILLELESQKLMTVNPEAKDEAQRVAQEELEAGRYQNRLNAALKGNQSASQSERRMAEERVRNTADPYYQELFEMAVSEGTPLPPTLMFSDHPCILPLRFFPLCRLCHPQRPQPALRTHLSRPAPRVDGTA